MRVAHIRIGMHLQKIEAVGGVGTLGNRSHLAAAKCHECRGSRVDPMRRVPNERAQLCARHSGRQSGSLMMSKEWIAGVVPTRSSSGSSTRSGTGRFDIVETAVINAKQFARL